jgi:hypothetical protein
MDPAAGRLVLDFLIMSLDIAALRDDIGSPLTFVVRDRASLPRLAAHGNSSVFQNSHECEGRRPLATIPETLRRERRASAMKSQEVLLRLYDRFNRHECTPSDDLFAADAVVECQPFRHEASGAVAWHAFVDRVATAFPDARLRADRLSKLADSIYQCVLLCSGTHRGAFEEHSFGVSHGAPWAK